MRLIDYFDASAQRYPSKTAFIQPDGAHLTYAEVEQQSGVIAAALHASALPETGKVAVYSPNDARAFIAMLAIFRSGRIWVPLNARNTVDDNSAFMNYTDVKCLFYHSSFESEVRQLRAGAPQLEQCICLDRDGGLGPSLAEFSSAAPSLPVNTSGGLVSKGHPIAATGLSMILEIVAQLRREAEGRQVEGARIGLVENGGGVIGLEEAVCAVTILEGST